MLVGKRKSAPAAFAGAIFSFFGVLSSQRSFAQGGQDA
jgi:hypothetical protein